MEEVRGGEGDDPEPDDEGADRENPFADRAVVGSEAGGFTDAEGLAGEADDHENDAEDEGEPNHGYPLYLI